MGNSPSTPRTYTVENEIITASNEVVDRLFSGYPSAKKLNTGKSSTVAPAHAPPEDFTIERYEPIMPAIMPTMEMEQDKLKVLEDNDKYWSQRFEQFEVELRKTNQVLDSEFKAAADEVNKRFEYQPKIGKKTNCSLIEQSLIQCYKQNPGQSLNCADLAKDYSDCVKSFANAAKKVVNQSSK